MIKTLLFLFASCLIICASPEGGRANRKLLVESDRILFLGDSITYNGGYVANFDTWLNALYPKRNFDTINLGLPSETVSGISEEGHANGKFPRPSLFTRIDSVLEKTQPDLVFACYGMNCGIYEPFDQQRFEAYQKGIESLKSKADAIGAKIIFITPPIFDESKKPDLTHYREVLEKYSAWLLLKRKDDWNVIDLQSHMRNSLDKERSSNKNFTYQKDAIHPNNQGHWIMTQPLLAWFGDIPSAEATSINEVITLHYQPASIIPLIEKRMKLKRDAWLAHTGHNRPGIKKGLPLTEAEKQTQQIDREIKRLIKLAGQ